jgi:hypothetical protein
LFDLGLIDQHVRKAVFDGVHPMALPAFQALWILPIIERLLAGRADQNFEQVFVEHAEILTEFLIVDSLIVE